MTNTATRALADLSTFVHTHPRVLILAVVWASLPVEFLIVFCACLAMTQVSQPLIDRAKPRDAHKKPHTASTPAAVNHPLQHIRPSRRSHAETMRLEQLNMPLDPDVALHDMAVSDACNALEAVRERFGKDGPPMPPAELSPVKPEVLTHVIKNIRASVCASMPGARVYDSGQTAPQLEVVIVMEAQALAELLKDRLRRGVNAGDRKPLTSAKLQKSALRHCTELLMSKGFKFKRSAFKAADPFVALQTPELQGPVISVNISVNNPVPLLNAALVHVASAVDGRAQPLILMVQRWAHGRGMSHSFFGPLTAYAWAHVAVYYLKVAARPPTQHWRGSDGEPDIDLPALLRGFFEFCVNFEWGEECISLRKNRRNLRAFIEDAYRDGVDLGSAFKQSPQVGERLKQEVATAARRLTAPGADLFELFDNQSASDSPQEQSPEPKNPPLKTTRGARQSLSGRWPSATALLHHAN